MCRAQPVFWCAGGVRVDAVLHATFGAQHLGMLASLPCYPSHATFAAGTGISTANEPLRRTLFTPIMGTIWVEEWRFQTAWRHNSSHILRMARPPLWLRRISPKALASLEFLLYDGTMVLGGFLMTRYNSLTRVRMSHGL